MLGRSLCWQSRPRLCIPGSNPAGSWQAVGRLQHQQAAAHTEALMPVSEAGMGPASMLADKLLADSATYVQRRCCNACVACHQAVSDACQPRHVACITPWLGGWSTITWLPGLNCALCWWSAGAALWSQQRAALMQAACCAGLLCYWMNIALIQTAPAASARS